MRIPEGMPSSGLVPAPTLHLVCGKICAGKSTLTRTLAAKPGTVLLVEDEWLSRLYPGELRTLEDFVDRDGRLRAVMAGHIAALLRAGVSVVLDFPSNTVRARRWARGVFEQAGAAHLLHFLDVPDEVCKDRLRARNAAGEHPYRTSDAEFDQFTSHFVPPSEDEGFGVLRYT